MPPVLYPDPTKLTGLSALLPQDPGDAPPPLLGRISGMPDGNPLPGIAALAPPTLPNVTENPRIASVSSDPLTTRKDQLEADLYNRSNPIPKDAPTTILGKIGHTAANIGNVLGHIFAPDVMESFDGTDLGNRRLMAQDKADLSQVSNLRDQAATRAQTEANTAYLTQKPQIEQAKILQKLTSTLAPKGIIATMNPDGTIDTQDDPDSQAYKNQVALQALHSGTAAYDAIKTENADQRYKPGTPQYTEWKQRLDNAAQANQIHLAGLGLTRERLGFDEDKTYNPEPTAQERTKGDLAQSAVDRIATLKSIVARRPDLFGPVAGRTTNAQTWLGSSDPDAATYNAAAQYLADHSAGVFGGRGEYITSALHSLTDPKFNPDALNAALNEAQSAASGFVKAGTTHARGQQGNAAAAASTASKPNVYAVTASGQDGTKIGSNVDKRSDRKTSVAATTAAAEPIVYAGGKTPMRYSGSGSRGDPKNYTIVK